MINKFKLKKIKLKKKIKIKARSGYTIKKAKPLKIFINVFEYFFFY